MPINELRKALAGRTDIRVKVFTASRTYEGTLTSFPSGEPAIAAHAVHLSNVTITEMFVKQPQVVEHVTIAIEHIEAYTL